MTGKFNLGQLMNDHSKKEGDAFAFKIEFLDIEQIIPSKMNFYTVDDVAELKASIELHGIQQNLVVRKRADGEIYELISGERRYTAAKQLVAEGNNNFRRVPCKIIKSIDDIQAELQLIFANGLWI
jgi:ParB family chromosome partitioning protein